MHKEIADSYATIKAAIASECEKVGRSPASVSLLAVSKGQPIEKIRALYACGQRDFGENYGQELWRKQEALSNLAIRWHFIGHLQSNKISRIVGAATSIQSVASLRHGEKIAVAAEKCGKAPYPVYAEVNISGEASKKGVEEAGVARLVQGLETLPGIALQGLMAIPAREYCDADFPNGIPDTYRELAALAASCGAGHLSLGMSADFRIAIRAGSHMIRIGRALFGERNPVP